MAGRGEPYGAEGASRMVSTDLDDNAQGCEPYSDRGASPILSSALDNTARWCGSGTPVSANREHKYHAYRRPRFCVLCGLRPLAAPYMDFVLTETGRYLASFCVPTCRDTFLARLLAYPPANPDAITVVMVNG